MINQFKNIKKYFKLLIFLLILIIFPKTSLADDVFRVTEYNITNFSGTTYNLSLNNALATDHFILIKGAESGNVAKSPQNSYVKVSKLPPGTNKSLNTSSGNNQIELTRYSSGSSSWVGVVTVVECLQDCDNNGFKTLDIKDLSTPNYTSTANRVQSGTVSSITNWVDVNKVTVFGGGLGSGTNVESTSSQSGAFNSGWLRLYPSDTNTINWERYNSSTNNTLYLSSHTVYVIEWGSAWDIKRVAISGSNGASGANTTSAYNTASISSVTRANTWVYGSGHSRAAAMANGAMGAIVTLGNGVAKNTSETTVAVGSQLSGYIKSFDVYVMTHPNLSVDYQFKTNGGNGSKTATVTTTSNSNTTARMSMVYSGMTSTTSNYPACIFSSRYTANTTITLQREYYPTGTQYNFASWVQGINWKNIQYYPEPTLSQYKFRWRDDTKNLNEANGWIANDNINMSLATRNINYRIRFSVANVGIDDSLGRSIKIQYGYKTSGSCGDITEWADLSGTENVLMSDSTKYTNQDTTSMIMNNPEGYIFIQGRGMDTTNASNPISLLNNRYTELEYSIKVASTAQDGTYCLRLFNATNNKQFDTYSVYPEISVGSYISQNYYRWYSNNNSVTPVSALASENSEIFANEGDVSRLRMNINVQREELNSKQFILQYSKNSISGPWTNVSNPLTKDKWWNNYYTSRRKINFGTSHSLLPSGYTASLSMDTRVGLQNGDDIRIVYQSSTGETTELDRIADVWNSATSTINFKLINEISLNTAYPTNGNYYVYYGHSMASNPPSNLNNIYAVYDDFNEGIIRSDWKTFDNDKVVGTSFTETNGMLNINTGGVDTWESSTTTSVDDYAAVYQDNFNGDFEATLKCVFQDSVATAANTGLMIKNDITKTEANNGYFINVDNLNAAYISAWDSNSNGYLDAMYYSSGGVTWPHCLRIKKQGTTFTATYSVDCITFSSMNSRTISDASAVQDIGIYSLSGGGKILSLGKFDYFKLIKLVSTNPTMSLDQLESKGDWEFYDSVNLNKSEIISQILLSNSTIGELYSEQNPTDINPNIIPIDGLGEYDFSLNSIAAEKATYYFRLIRSTGGNLDQYLNYAKLTLGNKLTQNSYRWYSGINAADPVDPIANENQSGLSYSKLNPLRLRMNIQNNLGNMSSNSTSFVLQYSKTLTGPWNNVGANMDWEFYDNSSVNTDSVISNTLLSNSTKKENYSEQNPTATNANTLSNNDIGEYDFSIMPTNATGSIYYFRMVKNDGSTLDYYTNYPTINVDTKTHFSLAAYKFFRNINSGDIGTALSNQDTSTSIEANSDFRLRILMHASRNKAFRNNNFFKLEFAEKGTGTCSSPQYAYSVLTASTAIGLRDNASIDNNVALINNITDPELSGTIRSQTYNEIGDFSNAISDIGIGEYGKWDFSLFDNNAGVGKTFCFRVINVDGTDIDTYINYPEITISSGVLTVDIVDADGNSVSNPIFTLDPKTFEYTNSNSQGIFGFDSQRIRISNSTSNPLWSVSLSATYGNTTLWTNGTDSYDFNDSTSNATDGSDADIVGGQMSVDPSFGSVTPKPGSTTDGITLASGSSFIEESQDSITLATSSSATPISSYWDIMGIQILQSIPALQKTGNYTINMTLTVIGN